MNINVSIHNKLEARTTCHSVAWHLILKEETGAGRLDIAIFSKNKLGLIEVIKKAESQRASEMLNNIRKKFIPE